MNITDQLQKIGIFLAQDRFVSILKKMADSFMTTIKIYRMTGEQSPHNRSHRQHTGSKQQVKMIGNKRPCETGGMGIDQYLTEPVD